MQHGSIRRQSDTSKDEERQRKLLPSRGVRGASQRGTSATHDNLSGLIVMPGLEGRDVVAYQFLVADLVVVVVVVDHALLEAVSLLALAGGLV